MSDDAAVDLSGIALGNADPVRMITDNKTVASKFFVPEKFDYS
jgi:hypothetical protein